MWRQATTRAHTAVHMGSLAVHPSTAFEAQMMELFAKISLPFISQCTHDLLQMALMSLVMLAVWLNTSKNPLYIEEKIAMIVQHLKLLTFLSMVCGTITVLINNKES